jgi:hypothetical protein
LDTTAADLTCSFSELYKKRFCDGFNYNKKCIEEEHIGHFSRPPDLTKIGSLFPRRYGAWADHCFSRKLLSVEQAIAL